MLFFLLTILVSLLSLYAVDAAPVPHSARLGARALSHFTRSAKAAKEARSSTSIEERSSGGPYFVYYADRWEDDGLPPSSSEIAGWNVFALSFWLSTGPADMALGWADLTADQRSSVKSDYGSAGIKLIVAAFGSTETPTSSGDDPTDMANQLAAYVKQYDLDGVDCDYEDFDAMNGGTAVAWLVTFTKALRSALGDDAWISHAPVAPWFTDSTAAYPGGDYLQVDQQAGDAITAYNIQFYNQGVGDYGDCTSLVTSSNIAAFPNTALLQIMANGVSGDKLLLGKPGNTADANNGLISEAELATCVVTAKAAGWNGGLMIWEFPDAPAGYVQTVWGAVTGGGGGSGGSGSGGSTTTTTSSSSSTSISSSHPHTRTHTRTHTGGHPTSTSAPTTTSSAPGGGATGTGGTCATSTAWSAQTAYTTGSTVTYQGYMYTAVSWSYNEVPGGVNQAWTQGKAC